MGIHEWLPPLLTLPSLAVALRVTLRLREVHSRVLAGSEDQLDAETSRAFLRISILWAITQAAVSLGLWIIPFAFGPQVLEDGNDRLTFDVRSWLFVAVSWLAGVGGLLLLRWLNKQLRQR